MTPPTDPHARTPRPNPENPGRNSPSGGIPPDVRASMTRASHDPRPDDETERSSTRRAGPAGTTGDGGEALLRWDELDEDLLAMLAQDPKTGARLRKLQDADAWLRARARDAAVRQGGGAAVLDCPPAEELFDYGQGPGAQALSAPRRVAIDRHLATCRECEQFVRTLAARPPSPLLVDPLPEDEVVAAPLASPTAAPRPLAAEVARPAARRFGARQILAPLAAAAAVLVAVVVIEQAGVTPRGFPEPVVLRGADAGPLVQPGGRVLVPSAELNALFPALGDALELRVEPQEGAGTYRFELERTSGGAFGAATPVVNPIVSATPHVVAPLVLNPGDYVWKAWVVVNGLDRPLGSRGFTVRPDPDIDRRLLELRALRGPDRVLAAIHLLDECGYLVDARTLAATLPPSPERDAYLARPRGR